ncbi:hypothetical protein AAE478_007300 [Parahypoxylon ruwenzoriense]
MNQQDFNPPLGASTPDSKAPKITEAKGKVATPATEQQGPNQRAANQTVVSRRVHFDDQTAADRKKNWDAKFLHSVKENLRQEQAFLNQRLGGQGK